MNSEDTHEAYLGNDIWICINKYQMVVLEKEEDNILIRIILSKDNIKRITDWLKQINQDELL